MYVCLIWLARSVKLVIFGIIFIFTARLAVLTVLLARLSIFHISTSNVHLAYLVTNKITLWNRKLTFTYIFTEKNINLLVSLVCGWSSFLVNFCKSSLIFFYETCFKDICHKVKIACRPLITAKFRSTITLTQEESL